MSKQHYLVPEGPSSDPITVRLGASAAEADRLSPRDQRKLVKRAGESRYELCTTGDLIQGYVQTVMLKTEGGFTVGGVVERDTMFVIADGKQADGLGNLAVGDYVVAGPQAGPRTSLSTEYPKVRKATLQLGAVPATLAEAGQQAKYAAEGAWVVASLYRSGTGAPGTIIVIKKP